MVRGLGNDIIEIARIERSISNHGDHFLDRLFTSKERAYCDGHETSQRNYAGRFAAKEAIAKALGCGFGEQLSWLDIEILNNENGKPVVELSADVRERFAVEEVIISISHCKEYASAVAIVK